MKKIRKITGILIIMIIGLIVATGFKTYTKVEIPRRLIIGLENQSIGTTYYEDFLINARKIISKSGLGYCLEIDKSYPSGEEFTLKGDCSDNVKNVLISGYPNKSAAELNLDSDNDAYFATQ